jgi:demethylmenaquinone methyltransferase/2-methoxy-6-polyprenyl-1,4-benzoquinol methylase
VSEILQKLGIQARSTVIDLGFGQPDELRVLAGIVGDDGKVYGIEPQQNRVAEAEKELRSVRNITVLTGDVHRIPLPDRSVDYVLLKGVLHEVPNVSKAFIEAARVCKLQGAILIVDFTAFSKAWLFQSNLRWRLYHSLRLLGRPLDRHPGFSRTNLEARLSSAGLKTRSYDENIATGSFGGHRIPMFLAVGEPA